MLKLYQGTHCSQVLQGAHSKISAAPNTMQGMQVLTSGHIPGL